MECVTEQLKAADQMEWVRRMNSIRNRAVEDCKHKVDSCVREATKGIRTMPLFAVSFSILGITTCGSRVFKFNTDHFRSIYRQALLRYCQGLQ